MFYRVYSFFVICKLFFFFLLLLVCSCVCCCSPMWLLPDCCSKSLFPCVAHCLLFPHLITPPHCYSTSLVLTPYLLFPRIVAPLHCCSLVVALILFYNNVPSPPPTPPTPLLLLLLTCCSPHGYSLLAYGCFLLKCFPRWYCFPPPTPFFKSTLWSYNQQAKANKQDECFKNFFPLFI